jgi:hypothetical protein
MNEKERMEILEEIRLLKLIYKIHSEKNIIQNEEERNKYLDQIIDRVKELEKVIKEDLDSFN